MWTCPNCKRSFRNKHQEHSCMLTSLESHLNSKQQNVKDTFHILFSNLQKLDGVRVNSVKNTILFTAKSNFLAIKPKNAWLDIEFVLDEKIEEFPIYKSIQATKTKWAHFVRLEAPQEVDEQLLTWVRKAFLLCK